MLNSQSDVCRTKADVWLCVTNRTKHDDALKHDHLLIVKAVFDPEMPVKLESARLAD